MVELALAGSASCNSLKARSPDLEEGKEQVRNKVT